MEYFVGFPMTYNLGERPLIFFFFLNSKLTNSLIEFENGLNDGGRGQSIGNFVVYKLHDLSGYREHFGICFRRNVSSKFSGK